MANPIQPPDLESSGLTIDAHLLKWDDYARDALHATIAFHGTHSQPVQIAQLAAEVADEMMVQRASRRVAHKETKDAERGAAKKARSSGTK